MSSSSTPAPSPAPPLPITDGDADVGPDEEELSVLDAISLRDQRPAQTSASYKRSQLEYINFIKAHPILSLEADPDLVTPERLFAWLDESLCVRVSKASKNSGKLSPSSLRVMISGVVDLWVYQHDLIKTNSHPHPSLHNEALARRLEQHEAEYTEQQEATAAAAQASASTSSSTSSSTSAPTSVPVLALTLAEAMASDDLPEAAPSAGEVVIASSPGPGDASITGATNQPTELFEASHHYKICESTLLSHLGGHDSGKLKQAWIAARLFLTIQYSFGLEASHTVAIKFADLAITTVAASAQRQAGCHISIAPGDVEDELEQSSSPPTTSRSVDLETCSHSSFAFWFYFRFGVSEEPFPDFRSRNWKQTKLLYDTRKRFLRKRKADEVNGIKEEQPSRHGSPRKEQAQDSQPKDDLPLEAPLAAQVPSESSRFETHKMEPSLGEPSTGDFSKSTSSKSQRVDGSSQRIKAGLDLDGAQKLVNDTLAKIGIALEKRKQKDPKRSSYLTGFTPEATRVARQSGHGHVARADMMPPAGLIARVFPQLNIWVEVNGAWPAHATAYIQDAETRHFIRLLAYFRIVLLQDAALLRKKSPQHWLLQRPMFKSAEFLQYSDAVIANCAAVSTVQALPHVVASANVNLQAQLTGAQKKLQEAHQKTKELEANALTTANIANEAAAQNLASRNQLFDRLVARDSQLEAQQHQIETQAEQLKKQQSVMDGLLDKICALNEELCAQKLLVAQAGPEVEQTREEQEKWITYRARVAEYQRSSRELEQSMESHDIRATSTSSASQLASDAVLELKRKRAAESVSSNNFAEHNRSRTAEFIRRFDTASNRSSSAAPNGSVTGPSRRLVLEPRASASSNVAGPSRISVAQSRGSGSGSGIAEPSRSDNIPTSNASPVPRDESIRSHRTEPVASGSPSGDAEETSSAATTMPPFKMSHTRSIYALAQEWWIPHGPHNTCIAQMETRWGAQWREDQKETRFFKERVPLMKEVHRRAVLLALKDGREQSEAADEVAAAEAMELELQGLPSNERSVYYLALKYRQALRQPANA